MVTTLEIHFRQMGDAFVDDHSESIGRTDRWNRPDFAVIEELGDLILRCQSEAQLQHILQGIKLHTMRAGGHGHHIPQFVMQDDRLDLTVTAEARPRGTG